MKVVNSIIAWAFYVCLALTMSACAGSSENLPTLPTAGTITAGATSSAAQMEAAPIGRGQPSQIVVFPFATSSAEVTLNQGIGARIYREYSDENQSAEETQLAQVTAQNICTQVATSLASSGWNAACQPRGTPVTGANTLIVEGVFNDISEGNRAQRMVIGLGRGQSVVDTAVRLYQYSSGNSAELMTFTTHADSGEMPGVGGPAHSWSEVPRRRSFACWRAGMVGSMLYLVRRLQRRCFAGVQATPDQQGKPLGSGGNASCVRMTPRPMRCRSWPT